MARGVVVNRRNPCHKDRILVSADLSGHTAIHHEPKTIEGRDAVIRWRTFAIRSTGLKFETFNLCLILECISDHNARFATEMAKKFSKGASF